MTEHRRRSSPSRWIAVAILIVGAFAAACTSTGGTASPAGSVVAPSVIAGAPPSTVPATAAPSPTATITESTAPQSPPASPSPSTVVLNPERCPPLDTTGLHMTADGTAIDGDEAFIAHVEKALALLDDKAPESYADVLVNVVAIRQVDSYSGMCYDSGTYRVGEETAHAPGYGEADQLVWLAGTIAHDGCHRERFVTGLEPSGRDAELACLGVQLEALRGIDSGGRFRGYVQTLIETVDDPDSQYWMAEDRHW